MTRTCILIESTLSLFSC